jgi:ketosteroid isomerase-like protein
MDQFHRKERHFLRLNKPSWHTKDERGPEMNSGRRFFVPVVLLSLALSGGCEFQRQPRTGPDGRAGLAGGAQEEIQAMLMASAVSWNEGDLDGFLDDYWRSDSLTFSGPSGVTRGWDDLRTRYQESYWAPGTVQDSLSFHDIEVIPLGDEEALALGRYLLFPREGGVGEPASGFFSLVLNRMGDEWRIVHDHTSSTPPEEAQEEEGV